MLVRLLTLQGSRSDPEFTAVFHAEIKEKGHSVGVDGGGVARPLLVV